MQSNPSTIYNLSSSTKAQVISLISQVMDASELLHFYYKSNNSTDNTLLEVFPLGLQETASGLQLMAVKIVNDEYVMRRYNMNNVTNLSIGDVAWRNIEWKDLHNQKDDFFSTALNPHTNMSLEAVYDWDNWGNFILNACGDSSVDADDEVITDDDNFIIKSVGQEVPKSFFFLPSAPNVLFCGTGDNFFKMSKRSIEKLDMCGERSESLLVMKSITPKEVFKIEDFMVGDIVKFNVPESSDWSKLKVTVSQINKGQKILNCVGVDKDNNVYVLRVFPIHIMPVTEKVKVRVASNHQAKKAANWD